MSDQLPEMLVVEPADGCGVRIVWPGEDREDVVVRGTFPAWERLELQAEDLRAYTSRIETELEFERAEHRRTRNQHARDLEDQERITERKLAAQRVEHFEAMRRLEGEKDAAIIKMHNEVRDAKDARDSAIREARSVRLEKEKWQAERQEFKGKAESYDKLAGMLVGQGPEGEAYTHILQNLLNDYQDMQGRILALEEDNAHLTRQLEEEQGRGRVIEIRAQWQNT